MTISTTALATPIPSTAEVGRQEAPILPGSSRQKTLDLSVVIPTKDEEADIASVVREVRRVCGDLGVDFEIIVVDGGSVDETA